MNDDRKRPPEAVDTETLDAGSPESEVLEEAAEADNEGVSAETRIAELEGEVMGLKDQVLRTLALRSMVWTEEGRREGIVSVPWHTNFTGLPIIQARPAS